MDHTKHKTIRVKKIVIIALAGSILGLMAFKSQPGANAFQYSWSHFQRAMRTQDFERTASMFDFPFYTEDNQIWLLAKNFPKDDDELVGEGPKPFSREDLKTYYNAIFPAKFRTFVRQLDAKKLLSGDTIRLPQSVQADTVFAMRAYLTLDATNLQLFYNKRYPLNNGTYEQEVLYEFIMNPDDRLKLVNIEIAE